MEEQEEPTLLDLFAGISLSGVVGRASTLDTPEDIAKKAYDIAESMIKERNLRKPNECNSSSNS